MNELPAGWAVAQLSEISADAAQYVPAAEETFTYIDIGSIDREAKVISAPQILRGKDAPSRARKKVAKGDTLVSMTRPNLNAVALVPPELDGQIASTGFDVLRPLDGIDPRWLGYLVRSEAFVTAMSNLVQGALYPAIRAKDVRSYVAPLASSAEQTRIADQIDILLARIKACNSHLDAIPGLLKRFRQAVFDSAITGKLTRAWRDSNVEHVEEKVVPPEWATKKALPALPEGWRWEKFSEFISNIRSGTSSVPSGEPSLYPVLRSSSVRTMSIDFSDVRYLPNLKKVHVDDLLEDGEVLFTRLSGSLDYVANCAVVRGLNGRKIYYPDRLFRARIVNPQQGSYFELCFSSPLLRENLTVEAKSTAGHQRISQGAITGFPIPLPPKDEQQEIIRQVQVLFAIADRIEDRYTTLREHAQRLSSQVLVKAFRGELVAQNSSDEPASVLIRRLANEQSSKAGSSRGRRNPRPLRPTNWTTLPDSEWAAPEDPQGQSTTVCLTAVLRAWGQPMQERAARLAALLCQQPHLFSAVLPAAQARQWSRLVGDDAKPLPANVPRIQSATNSHWGQAVNRMRARGDLIEASRGADVTWALGSGTETIDTSGWPDGRAGFIVAHLRAHGIESVLPSLNTAEQDFVNVRAA